MIFTQVYGPATGTSARGPWTRWDYKTADGTRHPHFADTQEIPLHQDVALELTPKGAIKSWKATGGGTTAPEAQDARPVGGVQNEQSKQNVDWDDIALKKTRCALLASVLPAVYAAADQRHGEQSVGDLQALLEWGVRYVYEGVSETVAF